MHSLRLRMLVAAVGFLAVARAPSPADPEQVSREFRKRQRNPADVKPDKKLPSRLRAFDEELKPQRNLRAKGRLQKGTPAPGRR